MSHPVRHSYSRILCTYGVQSSNSVHGEALISGSLKYPSAAILDVYTSHLRGHLGVPLQALIARIPSKSKTMRDEPCRLHSYSVYELAVPIYHIHWLRMRSHRNSVENRRIGMDQTRDVAGAQNSLKRQP
jgi:hypothetical protein